MGSAVLADAVSNLTQVRQIKFTTKEFLFIFNKAKNKKVCMYECVCVCVCVCVYVCKS